MCVCVCVCVRSVCVRLGSSAIELGEGTCVCVVCM